MPHDLPGAYRVCLQTGDSGRDASTLYRNPDLLGHLYVGPYIVGQPDLALVVADAEGIAGYLLATEDTRAFEAWEALHWWPGLREQYPATVGDSPDDDLIRLLHSPAIAPDGIVAEYPAHLHIDLLPGKRGRGLGRELVDGLVATLQDHGSRGVHLDVGADNQDAIAFYGHLGFVELQAAGSSILMGMRLSQVERRP